MRRVLCSAASALGIAAMFLAAGCNEQPAAPVDFNGITGDIVASTNNQTGIAGEELALPIQVEVKDVNGNLIQFVTVEWSVRSGDGTLYVSHSSSDAAGVASNRWTLGIDASATQTVHAQTVLPSGEKIDFGDFAATAIAGPVFRMEIPTIAGGDNQRALKGTAVADPLKVLLTDKNGNPVPGATVTFAIGFGGGNFGGGDVVKQVATSLTGPDIGVASLAGWQLGDSPCQNSVTAAIDGITPALIFIALARDCWTDGNPAGTKVTMSQARNLLGASVLGGELYAVGGSIGGMVTGSVEKYIPSLGVWAPVPFPMTAREGVGLAVVGGKLYAIGGCSSTQTATSPTCPSPLNTVERFDGAGWTPMPGLNVARANLAVAVIGNTIYAIGGDEGNGTISKVVEAWEPGQPAWTQKADLLVGRDYVAAGAHNGKLYVVGGLIGIGPPSETIEKYDPDANLGTGQSVILGATMTGRFGHAVAVVADTLYAMGGSTGFSGQWVPTEAVEVLNLNTLAPWASKQGMLKERLGLAAAVVDGVIFAVGGAVAGLTLGVFDATNATESYIP